MRFILLVLVLTIGSYADGHKNKIKWITPSEKTCLDNGGIIKDGLCKGKVSSAKNICSILDARLPSIDELKKVASSCGAKIDYDYDKKEINKKNSSYQSCYKKEGFESDKYGYWSSSNISEYGSFGTFFTFLTGSVHSNIKYSRYAVRCLKIEK